MILGQSIKSTGQDGDGTPTTPQAGPRGHGGPPPHFSEQEEAELILRRLMVRRDSEAELSPMERDWLIYRLKGLCAVR